MKDLSLNASSFPVADCSACGRVVLLHVTLDDAGRECRSCVHCDTPIDAEVAEVRWIGAGELEREGYYFGPPPKKGGAGGGCGSGGCGTCGTRAHS